MICPVCGIFLAEPFIRCAECPHNLCLQCFAKGKEFEEHKNHHAYSIVRNNLSVLHPDWMASEEMRLLNAVADHGIGNWIEIAKDVGSKNKVECQMHYLKFYIQNPVTPLSEEYFHDDIPPHRVQHPAPVVCNGGGCDEPPRPVGGVQRDVLFGGVGYMPARGDFSYEYNDFAELDIRELAFEQPQDTTWNDLQLAVLDIYRGRLGERARRKWLLGRWGMVSQRRHLADMRRYMPLGAHFLEHLRPLTHLLSPTQLHKFLEGYLWEFKTKQRIELLQQCRASGITRPHSVATFGKLNRRRGDRSKSSLDEILSQLKDEVTCQQYIRKQVLTETGPGRRSAPPIDIAAMSGYELLTTKERELCSTLRIFPSAFLSYKSTLLNEYRKLGSLRLANARTAIKIDVNKTRKIYDLLLQEGLITTH